MRTDRWLITIAFSLLIVGGTGWMLNRHWVVPVSDDEHPIHADELGQEIGEEAEEVIEEEEIEENTVYSEGYAADDPRRQWLRDSIGQPVWETVAPGVEIARAQGKWKTNIGDSDIWILRADPAETEFVIHSAKQDGSPRTAQAWCEDKHLIAAINAGMYQADHATNLGFMKLGDFVNQSRISNDKMFIAFGPRDPALPPARMIDTDCHEWEIMIEQYNYVSQSIRMMDCQMGNRWSRQEKYWSVASAGVDREGRLLLFHSRSPWAMHDFVDMVLDMGLGLLGMIYLEGGPEASLFIHGSDSTYSRIGSYETGFFESDDNDRFWPIPNVIGVRVRE